MRVVETCNRDSDYPNESFLNIPKVSKPNAEEIAQLINNTCSGVSAPRYWKVVPDNYKLAPTLEEDQRNS